MMAIDGDRVVTVLVNKPCFLTILQNEELGTGQRWLSVYRSVQLSEDHEWFDPFRDVLAAGPLRSEVRCDESMMFAKAELSVYAV